MWNVSHLQSQQWDTLKGNSTTLTLESWATETSKTSLENQLRLAKHHLRPRLDPCWYACDGCIVMIPSWFCLLWSSFLEAFQDVSGKFIQATRCPAWNLNDQNYTMRPSRAFKAVRTLIGSIKGTGCAILVAAYPGRAWCNKSLHFPERKGKKRGENKTIWREGITPQTMIRMMHKRIGLPSPYKQRLLNYTANAKIMFYYTSSTKISKKW